MSRPSARILVWTGSSFPLLGMNLRILSAWFQMEFRVLPRKGQRNASAKRTFVILSRPKSLRMSCRSISFSFFISSLSDFSSVATCLLKAAFFASISFLRPLRASVASRRFLRSLCSFSRSAGPLTSVFWRDSRLPWALVIISSSFGSTSRSLSSDSHLDFHWETSSPSCLALLTDSSRLISTNSSTSNLFLKTSRLGNFTQGTSAGFSSLSSVFNLFFRRRGNSPDVFRFVFSCKPSITISSMTTLLEKRGRTETEIAISPISTIFLQGLSALATANPRILTPGRKKRRSRSAISTFALLRRLAFSSTMDSTMPSRKKATKATMMRMKTKDGMTNFQRIFSSYPVMPL